MFTGIIEHLGSITAVSSLGRGRSLSIDAGSLAGGMKPGDSLAVNGPCLTVTGLKGGAVEVEVAAETLAKTNLGRLSVGSRVNLERPLAVGGRLHGHLVQGHVDTVSRIIELKKGPESVLMSVALPAELKKNIVPRGSVAIEGVSLTVARLEPAAFTCSLVGFTLDHTSLGTVTVGAEVNIETDIIGKYVIAALEATGAGGGGISAENLRNWGY
ncbi:MAG: riboflavin synthase [Gemmatimonadota bacterium]|nr:riboflavin synthase [Gemmatimonadota bacterium]